MNNKDFNKALKALVDEYVNSVDSVDHLYKEVMDAVEGRVVTCIYRRVGYNQSELSRVTELSRTTARERLKKYGLLD